MSLRPYLVFTQRSGKAPELKKCLTWADVLSIVEMSEGQCVIAYNLVSEVETHFDEEGGVVYNQ